VLRGSSSSAAAAAEAVPWLLDLSRLPRDPATGRHQVPWLGPAGPVGATAFAAAGTPDPGPGHALILAAIVAGRILVEALGR
jgi:hypothetical protein